MKMNKMIPQLLIRHMVVRSSPQSWKHKKYIENNASFFLMLLERWGEGGEQTTSSSFPSSTSDAAVRLFFD